MPRFLLFSISGLLFCFGFFYKSRAQGQLQPILKFEHTNFQIGAIGEISGPVYHHFHFTNTSKDTVWIADAKADCHCTVGEFPKDAIPPGGSGRIKVSYNPKGRPWDFDGKVIVSLRGRSEKTELRLSGKTQGGAETARFLPVEYVQKFQYNEKAIEAEEMEFKAFVRRLLPLLEKHPDLKVQIESSASQVPTRSYANNEELTRMRALEARERMKTILRQYEAELERIEFMPDQTLVQGPAYTSDYKKNMSKYLPFQYVKIRVY